jgi:hypothetical protein
VEPAVVVSILSLIVAAISATSAIFSARASTRSAQTAAEALALNREALALNKASSERAAESSARSAQAAEAALALNKEALAQNKASSERSAELTKKMFLRQGVIDLHMAWQSVSDLNPNDPVVPDVVRAAGALSLTASLWNHEVVDKIILYQNYWVMFDTLFRRLDGWEKPIPHLKTPGKALLTREIRKAHKEMTEFDLSKVDQSRL